MRRYFRTTFGSLSNRNYRLYFAGQGTSAIGTWMQKVAQAWLVLELTDSGVLLGVTAALQQLPTLLLSPWGGLLADRFDKRRILLCTQAAAAVPALVLGILTATDQVTLWMVMVLATVIGTIDALDKPARHTIVIEMVGPERLTNAVVLNNMMFNAGKLVGPAVAGVLISTVGMAYSFLINAASFAAVVVGLLLIRPDQLNRAAPAVRARGQLRAGFRYVRRHRALLGPLVLMTVTGLFAYEWTVTLPLLARDTFDSGAQVAGLMFTAMGAGAIFGALSVAGTLRSTPNRLTVTGLAFAAMLAVVALAPTLPLAFAALVLLGATSTVFRAVNNTLIQLNADPEMRGRTMALFVMANGGTTPLGGPLLGWLCETIGVRPAFALSAVVTAAAVGLTLVYMRRPDGPQPRPDPVAQQVPAG